MWWTLAASAGSVFINGVHVEPSELAGMTFENSKVLMDAGGNVHITAPGYTVRPAGTPAPAPTVRPTTVRPGPTAAAVGPSPSAMGTVPSGRWWLYINDEGSTGHRVQIYINGAPVKTAGSGELIILDVGKWLQVGANKVHIESMSTNATGGPLYAYLGRGTDQGGTVDLGSPDIAYKVGRSTQGALERDYTLQVTLP